MQRRQFLSGLGAMGMLPFFSLRSNARQNNDLRIRDLEIWEYTGEIERTGPPYQAQITPMTVYGDHRVEPYPADPGVRTEKYDHRVLYLRILTENGPEGFYGLIDREAARVVLHQLRPFLIGKNALAIETLWDQMHRVNRHSRAGHYMMAISAVDNALWDLRGRYFDLPVFRLLGGPTRDKVEAYASCLGYSVLPEDVRERSAALKDEGFNYQKWFFANGLADGAEGMQKNVALVRTLRETLGEAYEIMFDAFNGWDLHYAMRWAEMAEEYRPYWIEEAFNTDKIESFVELRESTSIPVATGEHFYGRWEVKEFLQRGAIDVIQADPEWCGGVSELVRICTLASAFDIRVVPHGHNIHAALHVVASQSPMTCPLCEYLLYWMPNKIFFEKYPLVPDKGFIALPERPGFGIELDRDKIKKEEKLTV